MKNSLAVYCFYDEDGVVDDYVCYTLSEINKVSQNLIVTVNGNITDEGYKKVLKYTSDIIIRDNEGMDAGAYKCALRTFAGDSGLEYNEIILLNNTFFGPFISFVDIFDEMRQREVDFWGLNYIDHKIIDYIQSYFLVFGKRVIESGDLLDYFENSIDEYTKNWSSVCAFFEVGLFQWLKAKGYTYSTYTFAGNGNLYRSGRISVEKYHLPILKRKNFRPDMNMKDVYGAVKWINDNTSYNIDYIIQNIERTYGSWPKDVILNTKYPDAELCAVPETELTQQDIYEFVKSNKNVYVYGTGLWAQVIYVTFLQECENVRGFVVSNGRKEEEFLLGKPVISVEDLGSDVGIILGLNPQNTTEVINNISEDVSVLSLWK